MILLLMFDFDIVVGRKFILNHWLQAKPIELHEMGLMFSF